MGWGFCPQHHHNIVEEGMKMTQDRIRIADVADALGLSTATVSKVIHGKTEKISDKTVKHVQQELERSGYIPNMAGMQQVPALILFSATCDIQEEVKDKIPCHSSIQVCKA